MKVLVIPDVHLKPWMFERAAELLKEGNADRAVCLMDIPDDWRQEFNLDLYIQTFDAAIQFAKNFPETLWCYGNHDICYPWNQRETGYSKIAPWTVCEKLRKLQEALLEEKQLAFLHRIDHVLFCHGGLTDDFVRQYVPAKYYNDIDAVIEMINSFGTGELWQGARRPVDVGFAPTGAERRASPLWYRPQYYGGKMYKPSADRGKLRAHHASERGNSRCWIQEAGIIGGSAEEGRSGHMKEEAFTMTRSEAEYCNMICRLAAPAAKGSDAGRKLDGLFLRLQAELTKPAVTLISLTAEEKISTGFCSNPNSFI